MDNNQHDFIKTIQQALGKSSPPALPAQSELFGTRPEDFNNRLNAYINKNKSDQKALLDLFIEQAELINMKVIPVESISLASLDILELVQNTKPEWGSKKSVIAWQHPLIDQLNLKETLEQEGVEVFTTRGSNRSDSRKREKIRSQLLQSYIGITSADFCVAQSATLVLRTRPDQPRAVSIVPSIHVAVIRLDQILENLKELYFRLKWDPEEKKLGLTNCMTFISGPSKTADIELVMVYGAHGPRQLLVYVITG
jgi:L-lactate dehydrogenase complex protein LldG